MKKGSRSGIAVHRVNSRRYFVGEFDNDKKDGNGMFVDGRLTVYGEWSKGAVDGLFSVQDAVGGLVKICQAVRGELSETQNDGLIKHKITDKEAKAIVEASVRNINRIKQKIYENEVQCLNKIKEMDIQVHRQVV